MKEIIEDPHFEKEWYEKAKEQTLETLPKFINHLMNDYEHDYNTICKAIPACMLATMSACNKGPQGGITGFQASYMVWELIPHMSMIHLEAGAKILAYYDMLFPQYENRFDKIISKKCFEKLQELAKEQLENSDMMHPDVEKHMRSIVDGIVPFGYKIKEEYD